MCWFSRLLHAAPEGDDEEEEERNALQEELFLSLADLYETEDKRTKKCKKVSLLLLFFFSAVTPTVIT